MSKIKITKFIRPTAVKRYVKASGKQITTEAIKVLDRNVAVLLDNAISRMGSFKRIRPVEILGGGE